MNPLPNPIDEVFNDFEAYRGKEYGSLTEYKIPRIRLQEAKAALQKIIDSEVLRGKAEEVRNHLVSLNATPSEYNEILSMPLMARLTELDQQIEKLVKV